MLFNYNSAPQAKIFDLMINCKKNTDFFLTRVKILTFSGFQVSHAFFPDLRWNFLTFSGSSGFSGISGFSCHWSPWEKGTTHPNSTTVLLKIYIFINETTQKVPGTFEKIIIFINDHPKSTRYFWENHNFPSMTTQRVPGTFEKIIIFHQWPPKKYQILNRIVFF